jgi:hypothetical protein
VNNHKISFRGPIDAIVQTYRKEGVRALYGGFGAVIIGGVSVITTRFYQVRLTYRYVYYLFIVDTGHRLISDWVCIL